MPIAIHVPRINNNDDQVKLVELMVAIGSTVEPGQVVAAVETDKAVVDVEAAQGGFVIAILGQVDSMATVGEVLIWLGATADEAPPAAEQAGASASGSDGQPTVKAKVLLARYGLAAADVPATGERLTADDVERHVNAKGLQPLAGAKATSSTVAPAAKPSLPTVAGKAVALRPDERGMLATVTWHRDHAVPGYIEVSYDPAPWADHGKRFGEQHGLLLNPTLALMAWRLVELAQETPKLNATLAGDQRHEYASVNLGFTVQAGEVLYLGTLHDAGALGELEFVKQLQGLQRRAAGHQLTAQETQGATIGFSSMARWDINRHIPILAPHTAVMVAHAVAPDGRQVLGATYDHRVLHGAAVAQLLKKLSKPRAQSAA